MHNADRKDGKRQTENTEADGKNSTLDGVQGPVSIADKMSYRSREVSKPRDW